MVNARAAAAHWSPCKAGKGQQPTLKSLWGSHGFACCLPYVSSEENAAARCAFGVVCFGSPAGPRRADIQQCQSQYGGKSRKRGVTSGARIKARICWFGLPGPPDQETKNCYRGKPQTACLGSITKSRKVFVVTYHWVNVPHKEITGTMDIVYALSLSYRKPPFEPEE